MTRVLFEPHADDAALFAAFTILKYRPRIYTVFGSAGDYGDTWQRAKETEDAMSILGGFPCEQWESSTREGVVERMRIVDRLHKPSLVFAPNAQCSHVDHQTVASAAREVFGCRLRTYHTYDANGKVTDGLRLAPFEPIWIQSKLRALARYESQLRHPRAHNFFLNDLHEWLGE